MTGGLIQQLTREPDGIVMDVRGVGPYRHNVATLRILPTNYRLQIGDLVWWQDHIVRWEGKRLARFSRIRETAAAAADPKLSDTSQTG